VFSWTHKGHLITPPMTPSVLLFLNMGLTTPSYGGIELRLPVATLGGSSKSVAVFWG
jgi:hypothetical protein